MFFATTSDAPSSAIDTAILMAADHAKRNWMWVGCFYWYGVKDDGWSILLYVLRIWDFDGWGCPSLDSNMMMIEDHGELVLLVNTMDMEHIADEDQGLQPPAYINGMFYKEGCFSWRITKSSSIPQVDLYWLSWRDNAVYPNPPLCIDLN